jgi:hypothetical protein
MAVATAASMLSSMLLTLIVVPVFHLALDDAKTFLRSPRESLARVRDAARGLRRSSAALEGNVKSIAKFWGREGKCRVGNGVELDRVERM